MVGEPPTPTPPPSRVAFWLSANMTPSEKTAHAADSEVSLELVSQWQICLSGNKVIGGILICTTKSSPAQTLQAEGFEIRETFRGRGKDSKFYRYQWILLKPTQLKPSKLRVLPTQGKEPPSLTRLCRGCSRVGAFTATVLERKRSVTCKCMTPDAC